jgi:fibronectin-binding autotransporter adhesin
LLLLLVTLVPTATALAQSGGTATPAAGNAWGALAEPAFERAFTAGALGAPACDTTFVPESTGPIPYYDAQNGNYLGTVNWTPNWDDTVGWRQTEVESPVWVDLTGGWNNGLPTSSSTACITSGTLPIHGPTDAPDPCKGCALAGTLEISAGAELDITNNTYNDQAHLVASGDIYNAGTIELGNWAGFLTDYGTLYNTGVISALAGNGSAYLYGNVDNSGTFNVFGSINLDQTGSDLTFTNTGTINIATGQTLDLAPSDTTAVFDLNGGTIANNGSFYQYGGTFSHTGGTVTGNPLVVDNADLLADSATGSAAIVINNGTDTLTGDVGASEVLTLSNSNGGTAIGYLTTASGLPEVTNHGEIDVGGGNRLTAATLFTNDGVVNDSGGGTIVGDFTNAGTLNANGNLVVGPGVGGTFTNTGTLVIAAGTTLSVSPSDAASAFDMAGGTIANNGSFSQYGGTFNQTAGTITGNSPEINGANLAPSGGSADLLINYGTDTLTSDIGANQTLTLAASNGGLNYGDLTSGLANLINAGAIDLSVSASSVGVNAITNNGVIETASGGTVSASTLTNTGTLSFGGGELDGNLSNEGSFDVTGSTSLDPGDANATITNTGAITIEGGQTLSIGLNTFDFEGGTINNNGAFVQAAGTFNHTAGTGIGNPLVVDDANLSVSPASGSASFYAGGTDTLTSNIGPSETVDLYGDLGNGLSSTPTTNAGTFNLGDGVANISQLVNTGHLTGNGGQIKGLLNNEGGTVSGDATVNTFDQSSGATTIPVGDEWSVTSGVNYYGGTLVNDGSFGGGGNFTLFGGIITNNGSVGLGGGTFRQVAGTVSGNPIDISGEVLELTPTSGSVSLEDASGTSYLLSDIPAADTLTMSTADPGYSIAGMLNSGAFTNAGTIIFFFAGEIHNIGTITNTGTIDVEGSGRIDGTLSNEGTIDAYPLTEGAFAGPGELWLVSNFTQSAAGSLDIAVGNDNEAEGIYHEDLYVAGTTTLGGALVLEPEANYVSSAALGDDDYFISFEGTLNGAFASVTTTPAFDGGLTFSVDYTDTSTGFPDVSAVVVALPTPYSTASPTISGVTTQGQALSETHGTWTDSPTGYTYQWQDCDSTGSNCTDVAGSGSSPTYTLTSADIGHTLRVVEVARNGGGSGEAVTSLATAVVTAPVVVTPPPPAITVPANSAPPTISGSALVGQTLTAALGSWSNSPTAYTYQWYRCSGSSCTAISGATLQTYTPTSADIGHTMQVAECAHNGAGASVPASSAASAVVASAPATTPPPPTMILTAKKVSGSTARFSFKASGKSSGFACALVRTVTGKGKHTPAPSYVSCRSPRTYTNLKTGKYTFYVRAIGPGGTGSPATYGFKVK